MSSLYIKNRLALIDYTSKYFDNFEELLNSDEFHFFMDSFLKDLKKKHHDLYDWVLDGKSLAEAIDSLTIKAKLLFALDVEDIRSIKKEETPRYLALVESAYHYWRNLHRFSVTFSHHQEGVLLSSFLSYDRRYNDLIIGFYRTIQEKLQCSKNSVYRQLQAGTNGSLLLCYNVLGFKGEYSKLNGIPVIQKVLLRSPIIIHLKHNKRIGTFEETNDNPIKQDLDLYNFFCYPCMVGDSYTLVFFHKDYTASAIGLANLFEFADFSKINRKPDCIVLFGVDDQKDETVFYYDEENDIQIGKISRQPIIEYFGYFKKMMLTLHNLNSIKRGRIPIHGAMINMHLKDGRKKGVVLMGDSGAGKSETIDALSKLSEEIEYQEIIFDDMGAMYQNDRGEIVAVGTETGAFVRLDDLDSASSYKDLDRSIFFNPESSKNARVITPVSSYDAIMKENKVDIFLYANNYTDIMGLNIMDDVEAFKATCKEGIRYAMGTTGEIGISKTYYANPFGPMQKQEESDKIIDELYSHFNENKLKYGELYTHLSLPNKDEGLTTAAKRLLELIEND